jgi:hypothetical protein
MPASDRPSPDPQRRRETQAKKTILRLGVERLGPTDEAVKTHIDGITDLERLDRMLRQAVTASSWQEILDTR